MVSIERGTTAMRMGFGRITLMLALAAMLGGCGGFKQWFYQDYAVTPLKDAVISPEAAIKEIKDALLKDDATGKPCFNKEATADSTCLNWRNAATAALLVNSDEACIAHMRTIYGNDAAYNVTLGTVTNLFAGAATLAEKVGQKSLFSGIALFSNAERSLINEAIYKTALVTTVSKKIREGRESRRKVILDHLRNDDIASYPVYRAISDVLDYHQTCSFMYGLERTIEEGSLSGTEHRRQVLESELRRLMGEAMLFSQKGQDEVQKAYRKGIADRIAAIHIELKILISSDTPTKDGSGDPPDKNSEKKSVVGNQGAGNAQAGNSPVKPSSPATDTKTK